MQALTRFVLGHKLLVVALWLVLATAGVLTSGSVAGRLTTSFAMPGDASRADAAIVAKYRSGVQDPVVPVLTVPAGKKITDPDVRAEVGRVFAAIGRSVPAARVVDYATTGDPAFVTADGRSTFALVSTPSFNPMAGDGTSAIVQHAVASTAPPSWRVQLTGISQLTATQQSGSGTGVLAESMLGALGALLVLAFVFASFLAIVPLVMAAISILTTFLAVFALTEITSVSQIVEFLIALIGLGVAIDYSLLVVTRWREERAHGKDNTAAVEAAMASAGRAVVFSGLTVGIGLLALLALPVPFLRSAGIGGVLIPLISVAVAVTLLPVLLATVGPKLDWPRIRNEDKASRGWLAWARFTLRRRGVAATAGGLALALLILPMFWMHVGEPQSSALAQAGSAHDALTTLTSGGVPSGTLTPIVVLTQQDAAADVAHRLSELPGVHAAVAPATPDNQAGGTALVTVLPSAETSVSTGEQTVTVVRAAVADDPRVLGVDGSGASTMDFAHDVYGSFPLMLGLIALATFVLLARAFRSLLLAAKAVLLNLLSLGAAYGVLVLVFQLGFGSNVVWGIPATGAITMWVPVMVFAFLFGLSMDYEVFILARMRESYDSTGSTAIAVTDGIGRTGRLVSSAALILALSFVAMSTAPQTDLKILATGLGAGILVDATLIRCLLVPALVSLFGRYNWWLPRWAAKVLRVAPSPLSAPARETAIVQPQPQLVR
jgi:RND superfamily putative drug exporter